MDENLTDDRDAFRQMASEFPVRTGIFTFGLPAFALVQLLNGYVHESSFLAVALFAALAVAFSVKFTQYQIAIYRREKVTR